MVNLTINPYTTDITLDDVNIIRLKDLTKEEIKLMSQKAFEKSCAIGWKMFGLSSLNYSPGYWDKIWLSLK